MNEDEYRLVFPVITALTACFLARTERTFYSEKWRTALVKTLVLFLGLAQSFPGFQVPAFADNLPDEPEPAALLLC